MLDIHFFRNSFDLIKAGIAKKRFDCDLELVKILDEKRLVALRSFETARALQQEESKNVASIDKKSDLFKSKLAELKELSDKVKTLEAEYKSAEKEFLSAWLSIPNIPDKSVPLGNNANDNVVVYEWKPIEEPSQFAKAHYDICGFENLLDFQRGNKVTGAGFPFYVGPMARLVRALISFFLDEAYNNGYTELSTPILVNEESATATGQLPDKEGQMYKTGEDFYLIPTAEVPVTNFIRGEILKEDDLPKKCCAYTPCFRREAGSWGKDVRGLNRLHQFDKVELVKWVLPENSINELELLRKEAENLLQKLELPYRVLSICTGDIGFPHAKQYDLEVFAAGQKRWLEVSSCSCFTDFQARRANIRYRKSDGTLAFVHTLNGSGLAVPRVLAAILENNLTENLEVKIPKVLQKWTKEETIKFC